MGRLRYHGHWRIATWAVAVAGLLALTVVADRLATERAVDGVSRRARASAILLAASFRRELDKFRLVPIVLADDREARDALTTRDPVRLAALNRKLEALNAGTRAANVYLLDARGVTVAASNWRQPRSFLGENFGFRAYFRDAMRSGIAQQFALGQRSRQPGLYIAKRLARDGRPLGVFVVKVDFGALEQEWRATASTAFVTDGRGIILVAANPDWRFQTTRALSGRERERARRSLEYGVVALRQNPLYAARRVSPVGGTAAARAPFVEAVEPVGDGWRVHVLAATGPAAATAQLSARLALAIAALVGVAGYLLWRHRRRVAAARVEAHTNTRLAALRDQLVQANKLATLGQITAGVGHEISQPLAAIGAYAHNARALVDRGQPGQAVEAIERIAGLVERIGLITRELRGFARRSTGAIAAVPVDEAVAGVSLLLRDRLRMLGAELVRTGPSATVRAERVRLEQVLVNLIQNALDAGARTVIVRTAIVDERVEIAIADDGPGLAPDIRGALFQPFKTTKQDGLGLGLVICHDLVAELGGALEVRDPARGAEIAILLARAP